MVGFFVGIIGLLGLFLTLSTQAVPWTPIPWERPRAIRRKDKPEIWWIATGIYAFATVGGLIWGVASVLAH